MPADDLLQRPLDAATFRIINLGTPTAAQDATYVDLSSTPQPNGTATPGNSFLAASANHVHSNIDQLLENDPSLVGTTYTPTYGSGYISNETWTATGSGLTLKTTDYTYTLGLLVATEVRKVYAPNGITIIGQITLQYIYSGNLLSSIVQTRDL